MESHDASSGDWSPRISFSYGFASKQRISSPCSSPIHDSDFEFSSFIGADLTPKWCMLSAEELFSDGKLRLSERSSELVLAEGEWREEEVSVCRDNVGRSGTDGETKKVDSLNERKLPTIRVGKMTAGIGEEAFNDAGISSSLERHDQEGSLTNRGDQLLSASCKLEKVRSPASREDVVFVRTIERSKNAGKFKSPISREDVVLIPKLEKLEMGATGSDIRLPTSREDLIPACRQDFGRKTPRLRSPTSREELMVACGRSDNKAEMVGTRGEAGMPTNRERLKSAADGTMRTCKETRAPVKWRGEVSLSRSKEDDANASQLRRFSRNPRSASMTVDSSSRLVSTTCVSLNNSRCPSPSRSFSLPATTPTSPTASRTFSVFSSSSSSSRYRNRIKDFFKLKKLAPKEAEPSSSSSCRLPISPRSFFPFFKSKEASANASDSTPTLPHDQQVRSSAKHVCSGAGKEQAITISKGQVSPLENGNTHIAIPPPKQSTCRAEAMASSIVRTAHNSTEPAIGSRYRIRHSYSLPHEKLAVLGRDGQIVSGVDEEALWNDSSIKKSNIVHTETESPGKQAYHKITRLEKGNILNMVHSRGGLVRHNKGLERPIPCTSSVRVTPVLNVPSCMTPSLRKTKPLLKSKTFSFESLFAMKGKTSVGYTIIAPTSKG